MPPVLPDRSAAVGSVLVCLFALAATGGVAAGDLPVRGGPPADGVGATPGPNVSIANVSAPDVVANGSEYRVVVELAGADQPREVDLFYAGRNRPHFQRTVTVPPEGTTVTLNLTAPDDPGSSVQHRVEVAGEEWVGITRIRRPARLVVTAVGNLYSGRGAVPDDEPVTVGGRIENEGGIAGTREVELVVDGETVRTENVTLDPGETFDVTAEVDPPDVDRYGSLDVVVRVGDRRRRGSVSVHSTSTPTRTTTPDDTGTGDGEATGADPTPTDSTTGAEPTATGASGGGSTATNASGDGTTAGGGAPGFGVGLALAALLAAVGLLGRRRRPGDGDRS